MPPMPWPDFAAFTDEDAHAVAQYLKSLPAVRHPVPAKSTDPAAYKGPAIVIPAPGAWDAPKSSPAAVDSSAAGGTHPSGAASPVPAGH